MPFQENAGQDTPQNASEEQIISVQQMQQTMSSNLNPELREQTMTMCDMAVVQTTNSTTTHANNDATSIFHSKQSFPLNLTRMLESVESEGLSHVVHWTEDEKGFVICDADLFLSTALPQFFG